MYSHLSCKAFTSSPDRGIKFMWNTCFESFEKAKNTPGKGCILAHCMGLGKYIFSILNRSCQYNVFFFHFRLNFTNNCIGPHSSFSHNGNEYQTGPYSVPSRYNNQLETGARKMV